MVAVYLPDENLALCEALYFQYFVVSPQLSEIVTVIILFS